jgi:hypothetical protein
MQNPPFSRRDFLRLSAAGMLGALLAEAGLERVLAAPLSQGRMTLSGIGLYTDPMPKITHARFDEVGASPAKSMYEGNPFNKKWFAINGEGYTYLMGAAGRELTRNLIYIVLGRLGSRIFSITRSSQAWARMAIACTSPRRIGSRACVNPYEKGFA